MLSYRNLMLSVIVAAVIIVPPINTMGKGDMQEKAMSLIEAEEPSEKQFHPKSLKVASGIILPHMKSKKIGKAVCANKRKCTAKGGTCNKVYSCKSDQVEITNACRGKRSSCKCCAPPCYKTFLCSWTSVNRMKP